MGLGGEVDDEVGFVDEGRRHRDIRHVAPDKAVPRIVNHAAQVLNATGVGELVEGGDTPVRMLGQGIPHEIAADEARTARDEEVNHPSSPSRTGGSHAVAAGSPRRSE